MRIFFSHSSEKKPVVRALRAHLPQHINAWIDEDNLLLGDSIEKTLKGVLSSKIDYVLLIIDEHAARSSWVAKEIGWALEKEREVGRRILLPIVVDHLAWESEAFSALRERKFIDCPARTASDIRTTADRISSMLFSLICRDFEALAHGGESGGPHHSGNDHGDCEGFATVLREIVFPHRDYNPLALDELTRLLNERDDFDNLGPARVKTMIEHVLKDGLIPGLVYDGATIYVREEHYRWKAEISAGAKALIARCAAHQVRSGDVVALDAGSTAESVAKTLCSLITNRALTDLKIVSNSVPAIEALMDTAVALGLDEGNELFELHVPSGMARPNTLSISETPHTPRGGFATLLRALGGADIAIVGANGIDPRYGFTTHSPRTASSKRQILRNAKRRFIVADSSKFGVHEDMCFATFKDDLVLITERSAHSEANSVHFAKSALRLWGPRARLMYAMEDALPRAAK